MKSLQIEANFPFRILALITVAWTFSSASAINCPRHSHYSSCADPNGLSCTNFHYNSELSNCTGGCVCNDGYILDKNKNLCVLPKNCPGGVGRCGPNAKFQFCVACGGHRTTCANYGMFRPLYCLAGCTAGCFCNDGYIYDEKRKACVRPFACKCGPNEYFEVCDQAGPEPCSVGCTCLPGFSRDSKTGVCTLKKE